MTQWLRGASPPVEKRCSLKKKQSGSHIWAHQQNCGPHQSHSHPLLSLNILLSTCPAHILSHLKCTLPIQSRERGTPKKKKSKSCTIAINKSFGCRSHPTNTDKEKKRKLKFFFWFMRGSV